MNTRVFAAVVALALPMAAQAQQVDIIGSLSNFDVFNRTGIPVNDFKVTIFGLNPGLIQGTYTNPIWGPGQVMAMPNNVMITWGPSPFFAQPGQVMHFGVSLFDNPLRRNTVCFDWTLNGTPVPNPGDPNRPQQIWDPQQRRTVDVIRNTTWRTPRRIWVQRFANVLPRAVALEELVDGSPALSGSMLIDSTPVLMDPESELVFDSPLFDNFTGIQSNILWYRSFEDNGGVPGAEIGTTYNAAVVPGPGAWGIVLAGLAVTASRRRR